MIILSHTWEQQSTGNNNVDEQAVRIMTQGNITPYGRYTFKQASVTYSARRSWSQRKHQQYLLVVGKRHLNGIKHNSQILETRMWWQSLGADWGFKEAERVQQSHLDLHYDSLHLRRVPWTYCYCYLRFLPFLTLTSSSCYYFIFFSQNPLSLILFFLRCLLFLFYNFLSFSVLLFVFLNLTS